MRKISDTANERRNGTPRWERYLLAASVAASIGCSKPKIDETGIWLDHYEGEVAQDQIGYYAKNRMIISFSIPVEVDAVENMTNGKVTGVVPTLNAFSVDVDNVDATIQQVKLNSNVVTASRDYYLVNAYDNEDYGKVDQAYTNGLWWSQKIQLPAALDLLAQAPVGRSPLTIAVIDGGFHVGSPYKEELPYVSDTTYHYNFQNNNSDVETLELADGYHGTNVSLLAAALDNTVRTNGVAIDNVHILPIKLDLTEKNPELTGDYMSLIAALSYVTQYSDRLNIKVVNISAGVPSQEGSAPLTQKAIDQASEKGMVIVAAVGNSNIDACRVFPSSLKGVIAVGGTAVSGGIEARYYKSSTSGSNYATDQKCLTVAAPSQNILIFDKNGNPGVFKSSISSKITDDGTSYGAPMVSGLVAIIKSIKPDATYDQVVSYLRDNADDITLSNDPVPQMKGQIWKRINVKKTVQALLDQGYVGCKYTVPIWYYQDISGFSFDGDYIFYKEKEHFELADPIRRRNLNIPTNLTAHPIIRKGNIFPIIDNNGTEEFNIFSINNGSLQKLPFVPKLFEFSNGKFAWADDKWNIQIYDSNNNSNIKLLTTGNIYAYHDPHLLVFDGQNPNLFNQNTKIKLPSDFSIDGISNDNNSIDDKGLTYLGPNYVVKYFSFSSETAIDVTPPSSFYQFVKPSLDQGKVVYLREVAPSSIIKMYDVASVQTTQIVSLPRYLSVNSIIYRKNRLLITSRIARDNLWSSVFCQL